MIGGMDIKCMAAAGMKGYGSSGPAADMTTDDAMMIAAAAIMSNGAAMIEAGGVSNLAVGDGRGAGRGGRMLVRGLGKWTIVRRGVRMPLGRLLLLGGMRL